MGLFDFGDRATVQTLAHRIGVGVQQMEDELIKSPTRATPELQGIAQAVGQTMEQALTIVNTLSRSSQASLKVKFKGRNIDFWSFFNELVPLKNKVFKITGYDFLENAILDKDGIKRKVRYR